jgi:hypothetical protein
MVSIADQNGSTFAYFEADVSDPGTVVLRDGTRRLALDGIALSWLAAIAACDIAPCGNYSSGPLAITLLWRSEQSRPSLSKKMTITLPPISWRLI